MSDIPENNEEQILRFAQDDEGVAQDDEGVAQDDSRSSARFARIRMTELLSACQLEIELAWHDGEGKGRAALYRLAAAHPELADELYDFFALVIETNNHLDRPQSALTETDRRVRELLSRTRQENQPRRPKTFLALVREATGESIKAIAASMEVTPDFLVDASDHGRLLPLRAREELVRRARVTRDLGESELLASFDAPSGLRRAASRDKPYAPSNVTYIGLVKRSSLSAAEKQFWSGLA